MKFFFVLCTLFLIGSAVNFAPAAAGTPQKVRLRDVEVLTFQKGELTNGRRSACISQLQCVGGAARSESNLVETVQCRNMGFDGQDVNWECKTHIEPYLKLGKTAVSCEGYDYPDDPYVLVGSCGLEYTLEYTNGQPPRRRPGSGSTYRPSGGYSRPTRTTPRTHTTVRTTRYVNGELVSYDSDGEWVVFFFFFFVMLTVLVCWCTPTTTTRRRERVRVYPGQAGVASGGVGVSGVGATTGGSPPVVVVDNTRDSTDSSASAFTSGMVVGSMLTHRRTPATHTHTHTETVITSDPPAREPSPTPATPPAPSTEESTSFAKTKRR